MSTADASPPSLRDVASYFLRLGATGFGGPVALANYMRHDWVEERRWISEQEYNEGLAIATACPGPLAYQLGVYCGYISQGLIGGLVAALAFGLPPFLLVLRRAALYARFVNNTEIPDTIYGVTTLSVVRILSTTTTK